MRLQSVGEVRSSIFYAFYLTSNFIIMLFRIGRSSHFHDDPLQSYTA